MRACPRLLVAAPQSGAGKTSVTLGIVTALRARGLKVQTFKVGPDFLDPTYLRRAAGRPCYNLDGWMSGRDHVVQLVSRASEGADIAVVEGVMGLFDGAAASTSEGSSAEIARWLGAPVLLVVNAHGQARSIAPLVKGFHEFEEGVELAGVVANQCGSERHRAWLEDSLAASHAPPLVGAIPRGGLPQLPSRHLGLVTAGPESLPESTLLALGEVVEQGLDLDLLLALARRAAPLSIPPPRPPGDGPVVRLGLAWDDAFHFYYEDNLEVLAEAGCELVRFSPLKDPELPGNLDGLYLGGGYPEEHARTLGANQSMLADIRDFAASGRMVYAECGGLITLCDELHTLDGARYSLAGVLPGTARMLPRRKALGYVEVTTRLPGPLGPPGVRARGHEFHYSELIEEPRGQGWRRSYKLEGRRGRPPRHEGFSRGSVLASYVHLHFAAQREVVSQVVAFCRSRSGRFHRGQGVVHDSAYS